MEGRSGKENREAKGKAEIRRGKKWRGDERKSPTPSPHPL